MSFESILDLKLSSYKELPRPTFFLDLNLKQILDKINQFWTEDVTPLFYFPADKECEDYRRDVFGDMKKPEVFALFTEFNSRMKEREKALQQKNLVRVESQKATWHLREVDMYCKTFVALCEDLEKAPIESAGLMALKDELKEYLASDEFVAMRQAVDKLIEELFSFRVVLTYENNQIVVSEGEQPRTYDDFLKKGFPENKAELRSPFASTAELTNLELEVMKVMSKKHPEFFKGVVTFYQKYQTYAKEKLVRVNKEVGYYLSFVQFEKKMQENGFLFATPKTCEREEFSAFGLYDLALACVNMSQKKPVISNDFTYGAGEQFFVLTGPNQGGKTTFARSLGQLIFFSKMGFDVAAASAKVPYFNHILTHFSVEESLETGRGKLKEELVRLQPMMDSVYENTFVIINELFTTAANYDACIMGNRVLEHFIKQNCMGIYVTHLRELSEGHKEVVSLRATLDENRMQSYKIIRSAADDSACAVNQVNKYQLTYDQLSKRLGERREQ